MPANEVLELTVVCCTVAVVFVSVAPSRNNLCRDLAVASACTVTLLYTWQRYAALEWFDMSRPASWWQWSFAITEGLALTYELWLFFVLRRMSDHSAEADRAEVAFRRLSSPELPSIAMFIPTFNESAELVKTTLQSAMELRTRYKGRLHVYCLDDGRYRPVVKPHNAEEQQQARKAEERWKNIKDTCDEFGVKYKARKTKHRAKAGNLRFAFRQTDEDFIVFLDADFHVHPDRFLPRTIGLLLQSPDLGIVQIPPSFINPDPVGNNLCAPGGICDSQTAFMHVVQGCRDYYGNAFCVGSGWVARRAALEAVGGLKCLTTVTEDIELSYRLSLGGYRTCYLNEPLSYGLAPESLPAFLNQQSRWCCGSFQQLELPTGPLHGRHRLVDRLFYLDPVLFWLTHLATLQVLIAPLMLWFLAIDTIPDPNNQVLATILPRLCLRAILMWWLTDGIALPVIAAVHKALAAPQVCLAIAKWLFIDPKVPFRPTEKDEQRTHVVVRWAPFLTFAGIACMTLTGIMLNELDMLSAASARTATVLNYAWSLSGTVVCFLAALVSIELPTLTIDHSSLKSVQKGSMARALYGVVRRMFGMW